MAEGKAFTTEQAKRVGDQLRIDWKQVDLEEFRMGMAVELEHGTNDPKTDVTHDDPLLTGKIAWAHINEYPDYYTRLGKMEGEAEQYWATRKQDKT